MTTNHFGYITKFIRKNTQNQIHPNQAAHHVVALFLMPSQTSVGWISTCEHTGLVHWVVCKKFILAWSLVLGTF
jgi:hypothetical protein